MAHRFGRRLCRNLRVRLKQKDIDFPRRGRNNRQARNDGPLSLMGEAALRFGEIPGA